MAMHRKVTLTVDEQDVLDHLEIQLLGDSNEIARADQLVVKHHYLHDATLVGEHLRYVASYKGQWLAIGYWSAASLHLKSRDQFIGWTHEQCRRRRALIANNARLLCLPQCSYPNLVSRFMKLMLQRLSDDWMNRWRHPIAFVETFVDPRYFQGTCYKASGWALLGHTAGWKRHASDFYLKHEEPKQIWCRALKPDACDNLKALKLPQQWQMVEDATTPGCVFKASEIRGLMQILHEELPEFRRPCALAYPLAGMIALMVMAIASEVQKGAKDLAQFAEKLSQGQLRALKFRTCRKTRKIRYPKRTTFQRVLEQIDGQHLEELLIKWQNQLLPTPCPKDNLVILDGKKLRHGKGEIVNALNGEGRFLGSVFTPEKTNEITAARQLLGKLELGGKIVLADALHTNYDTAYQILFEHGADYLFTVKGNQPKLEKTLEKVFTKHAFSPSVQQTKHKTQTRTQLFQA